MQVRVKVARSSLHSKEQAANMRIVGLVVGCGIGSGNDGGGGGLRSNVFGQSCLLLLKFLIGFKQF